MQGQSEIRAVTKIPTGIAGFDAMTRGGIPQQRTTLLMGGPGCGKTVFVLQTLMTSKVWAPVKSKAR